MLGTAWSCGFRSAQPEFKRTQLYQMGWVTESKSESTRLKSARKAPHQAFPPQPFRLVPILRTHCKSEGAAGRREAGGRPAGHPDAGAGRPERMEARDMPKRAATILLAAIPKPAVGAQTMPFAPRSQQLRIMTRDAHRPCQGLPWKRSFEIQPKLSDMHHRLPRKRLGENPTWEISPPRSSLTAKNTISRRPGAPGSESHDANRLVLTVILLSPCIEGGRTRPQASYETKRSCGWPFFAAAPHAHRTSHAPDARTTPAGAIRKIAPAGLRRCSRHA